MRAAADAVQRLAYEDGVRLYGSALALAGAATGEAERCRTLMALGRAAYFAGDVEACVAAAVAAADAAVATGSPTLLGDAALVLEVTADPAVNAVAERLCEQALTGLGHDGHEALRAVAARPAQPPCLLRRRRWSGRGVERRRPRPGPRLARRPRPRRGPAGPKGGVPGGSELMALASRTRSARAAMWGELWQVEALIERGELAAAYEGLAGLRLAAERVGGPVSAWHFDRVAACIAQAQGRFADAAAIGRRAFERMRPVEPGPARGGYFALHCALARHVGISDDVAAYVGRPFEPLPRFRTMGP
jgi:hypothetical protein